MRLQLALVYVFAGVAKLNPDWLLTAQPLRIWLRANTELPLIGPLFDYVWVAFAMSWAGMLYDLSIPLFLLWRKTRPFAYLAVIAFHVLTALLFPIGMFPWIMLVSTLVFFTLEDYQSLAARLHLPKRPFRFSQPKFQPGFHQVKAEKFRHNGREHPSSPARSRLTLTLLSVFFLFQVGMCLRHYAYPGSVLWSEEGYRFSWRVMLAEKTGNAVFHVTKDEETRTVFPSAYLTPLQVKQMAFQPDMILQFAHFLAQDAGGDARVYADVWVSVNGRPSSRLVDPETNLAGETYGLARRDWIVPEALTEPDGLAATARGRP